jgi:hypothetical protein
VALYSKGPSAAEAAAWGLTVEEASGAPVEVWPDNAETIGVFISMGTQWRMGMSGTTGLDYNALPAVMRLCGVPSGNRSEVFEGVRMMEDAALSKMHEKK